ncbi:MAG: hypothetical protein KBA87_03390 [Lachnospiraceae bacterium]|jgi:flagellar motility protein MotE (MotC chaperone)|nr:hypothetical protein [Lachnospiraceae bacterium]
MADNEKKDKLSRKEQKELKKKQKLEANKAKKVGKEGETPADDEEEEETVGGGLAVAIAVILIIAVWLVIFGLLIKMDVGGFGSTVLYPVLKDVPVINKILPNSTNYSDTKKTGNESYNYTNLSDAVNRIKELEKELKKSNDQLSADQATIADLQSQVEELKTYKNNEANFETLKKKFDEEVVFSSNAPDISKYKEYYESIDPDNAQAIYKEVVEQQQDKAQLDDYVKTYSAMKPAQAASIFDTMTDNLPLVAKILNAMDSESRGKILGQMTQTTAAQVTKLMEP